MINQNGVVTKTSHVLKQALEIMPDMTWLSDDPTLVDIPPHVQDLLRVRRDEISRLTANLSIKDLTAAQSMAVSVERDFWLKDLAAAWRLPITEAGVSLNTFVSLD